MPDRDLSPFKPQESPEAFLFEITDYIGFILSLITYGVSFVVCSTSIYYLATTIKSKSQRRHNIVWIICILTLFAGGTVNVMCNILPHVQAWVIYRNYPGGSIAFLTEVQNSSWGDWVTFLNSALVDVLLMYRVYVVYGTWYIIIVPVLVLVLTMVFGPLFILQMSHQAHSWFAKHTLQFTIPYFAAELSLNILLTFLLAGRLMFMARSMSRTLGPKHGKLYSRIARMIVETSFPYAVVSFVLLVLYVKGSFGANVVLPIFVQVQVMSPALIIIRVCQGRAWNNEGYEARKAGETAITPNRTGEKSTKVSVIQFHHTVHEGSTAADMEAGYYSQRDADFSVVGSEPTATKGDSEYEKVEK